MKIAFVVYDGMTVLDLLGAYDPITRLDRMGFMSIDWDLCARSTAVTGNELTLDVDRIRPDLAEYDLLFLPGGFATRGLRNEDDFIGWLRTAGPCEYKTSVCTGSLLLGAAGFLDGRKATTHPSATDILSEYATVVDKRVIQDKDIITGRGVSSAIDLGLYIVEVLSSTDTRAAIAEQMDYPYDKHISPNE